MSQRFFARLLSATGDRVRSEKGDCMICLEDYNTLNTSTGVIECEVRLPCGTYFRGPYFPFQTDS